MVDTNEPLLLYFETERCQLCAVRIRKKADKRKETADYFDAIIIICIFAQIKLQNDYRLVAYITQGSSATWLG